MRKILLAIILLILSWSSVYAESYTNPDGSTVTIDIPNSLPVQIRDAVRAEIDPYLPTDFRPNLMLTQGEGYANPRYWEYTFDVKKVYSNKKITSVVLDIYLYTGGAHGMSARVGLVYETESARRLDIGNFYDTEKLVKLLAPIWEKKIKKELKKLYGEALTQSDIEWIQSGVDDITDYTSFVITPSALVIYGQEYQHNAYAYGTRTLTIPLIRLKGIKR